MWYTSCGEHIREAVFDASATRGVDNVVNLENAAHGLGGEGDGAGGDEERLHHVLLQDVGNGALSHVDAGRLLTLQTSHLENILSSKI